MIQYPVAGKEEVKIKPADKAVDFLRMKLVLLAETRVGIFPMEQSAGILSRPFDETIGNRGIL